MERHGKDGQATDDNKLRYMRCACWITKATNSHSEYVILFAFHTKHCYANGLYHVIHSLSSLSYDRSKASSKASYPYSAIQSVLLQMRIPSPFLKVIQ
jgi:hypothetical protein